MIVFMGGAIAHKKPLFNKYFTVTPPTYHPLFLGYFVRPNSHICPSKLSVQLSVQP